MSKFRRFLTLTFLLALGWSGTLPAHAESRYTVASGSTSINLQARLDLEVSIPRLLYLRVGTGTALANNAQINLIDFTVPASALGSGAPITAAAASGDLGSGVVSAVLLANDGNVVLSSTTTGALSTPAGGSINYQDITTTETVLTSTTPLPAPSLANGATTSITVIASTQGLIQQDARWTYRYANSDVVASGVYGGVNTQNGRVVYTATMP